MATATASSGTVERAWTGALVRRLRGKRTQEQFGRLLGVPKNTVWRWESGRVTPDVENSRRLSQVAKREGFRDNWKVAGSLRFEGAIDGPSRSIQRAIFRSLLRTARELVP